jgi:hypothetical protein
MPAGERKHIRYPDGQEVRLGDSVLYGGEKGTVVAHAPSSSYDPAFPREEWEQLLSGGFLLRFENGALLRLDECDEDTQLLGRE